MAVGGPWWRQGVRHRRTMVGHGTATSQRYGLKRPLITCGMWVGWTTPSMISASHAPPSAVIQRRTARSMWTSHSIRTHGIGGSRALRSPSTHAGETRTASTPLRSTSPWPPPFAACRDPHAASKTCLTIRRRATVFHPRATQVLRRAAATPTAMQPAHRRVPGGVVGRRGGGGERPAGMRPVGEWRIPCGVPHGAARYYRAHQAAD